ncbi:MAG: endonuclease III [Myxococcota bacterium]
MKDADIHRVMHLIARWVPQFDDQPSVGIVAEKTHDPYLVLVSTLISLRTREEVTRRVMWQLFELADTPRRMVQLSEDEIARAIAPARYADQKARTIRTISQQLLHEHHGRVPDDLDALLRFKGVGRKTANLVLTLGFGKPGICVDIHVHRIFNRLGYVRTRTPEQTEATLREKLPRKYWIPVNNWLVTFGRNQCTPTGPRCSNCPVETYCEKVGVTTQR